MQLGIVGQQMLKMLQTFDPKQPVAIAFSRSPAMACAVSAMIGIVWVAGIALSLRVASQPSSTGRLMSIRIRSGCS